MGGDANTGSRESGTSCLAGFRGELGERYLTQEWTKLEIHRILAREHTVKNRGKVETPRKAPTSFLRRRNLDGPIGHSRPDSVHKFPRFSGFLVRAVTHECDTYLATPMIPIIAAIRAIEPAIPARTPLQGLAIFSGLQRPAGRAARLISLGRQ